MEVICRLVWSAENQISVVLHLYESQLTSYYDDLCASTCQFMDRPGIMADERRPLLILR